MYKEQTFSAKDLAHVGIFTALTALGAFISIPIGPVPITLQSLFVILSGLILGSKKAAYSQITYLLLGLMGFPIFSGFSGGLQHVIKPSFGFIIGYIGAAYITGKLTEGRALTYRNLTLAVLIGSLVIYGLGLPYMYYILNIMLKSNFTTYKILQLGMLAFIPGDLLKALIIIFSAKKIKAALWDSGDGT